MNQKLHNSRKMIATLTDLPEQILSYEQTMEYARRIFTVKELRQEFQNSITDTVVLKLPIVPKADEVTSPRGYGRRNFTNKDVSQQPLGPEPVEVLSPQDKFHAALTELGFVEYECWRFSYPFYLPTNDPAIHVNLDGQIVVFEYQEYWYLDYDGTNFCSEEETERCLSPAELQDYKRANVPNFHPVSGRIRELNVCRQLMDEAAAEVAKRQQPNFVTKTTPEVTARQIAGWQREEQRCSKHIQDLSEKLFGGDASGMNRAGKSETALCLSCGEPTADKADYCSDYCYNRENVEPEYC